jgi:DNA-binding Lrp family transcriptional regulator
MMTVIMIDVEAGQENLFEKMYSKLVGLRDSELKDKIEILYQASCYTHSDISLMVDVKDPEALPSFMLDVLLTMEGVWDIQIIPLLNPKFFIIPDYITKEEYKHFTITLDVKSYQTKAVYEYLNNFAKSNEIPITFLAYTFYSYDNDIIFSLLAPSIEDAGKFVLEKIRPIDGVVDSYLWQTQKWEFIIPNDEWLNFINSKRLDDPIDAETWNKQYKDLRDSYICCC